MSHFFFGPEAPQQRYLYWLYLALVCFILVGGALVWVLCALCVCAWYRWLFVYVVWGRGPVRGFGFCLCELCWVESFGGWWDTVSLN